MNSEFFGFADRCAKIQPFGEYNTGQKTMQPCRLLRPNWATPNFFYPETLCAIQKIFFFEKYRGGDRRIGEEEINLNNDQVPRPRNDQIGNKRERSKRDRKEGIKNCLSGI